MSLGFNKHAVKLPVMIRLRSCWAVGAFLTFFVIVLASSLLAQPLLPSAVRSLTMLTSPDYLPYEYYDILNGERKIVGFDIDLATRITGELGYKLKINESDFNSLMPALQAKRVDFVMAGMTPTPERQKMVDFSTIYLDLKSTIIAPKASNLKSTKDLAGKIVGVQIGSIQEGDALRIAEKMPGMKIKQLNKLSDIFQEIKSRRIDAAIVEEIIVQDFIASSPDLMSNVIPSEGPSGSAVAFPKGSTLVADFNKVLEKMKASGEIKALTVKWFATPTLPVLSFSSDSTPSVPSKSP